MVTPVENVIRHVRLCAQIERFAPPQKSVVANLLASDDSTMVNMLSELKGLRVLAGSRSAAIGASITRIEDYVNATRLLKSTMVTRLKTEPAPNKVVPLPIKAYKAVKPVLLWTKKPVIARSKKVVELFAAT